MLVNSPTDAFLLFALGQELRNSGEATEALQTWEKLVAAHPAYHGVYYQLGSLLQELGQHDRVEATYKAGMNTAKAAGDQQAISENQNALTSYKNERAALAEAAAASEEE